MSNLRKAISFLILLVIFSFCSNENESIIGRWEILEITPVFKIDNEGAMHCFSIDASRVDIVEFTDDKMIFFKDNKELAKVPYLLSEDTLLMKVVTNEINIITFLSASKLIIRNESMEMNLNKVK